MKQRQALVMGLMLLLLAACSPLENTPPNAGAATNINRGTDNG